MDGVDIPIEWVKDFRNADAPICMTQFAINEFMRQDPFIKIGLIPRGINLANFYPEKDKNALRERFCKPLIGKFTVGWVDRNQSRKNVPPFLEACRLFIQDKSDVMIYMHCCPDDSMGWDLQALIPKFGLDGRVAFTKGLKIEKGVPDSMMRIVYNLFDIKVSTTQGEGFGLCVTPDSIIHSLNGPKSIAEVEVGERVLTKNGNFKIVLGKKVRKINEPIYQVQLLKNKRKIKCTEGEKFWGIKTTLCTQTGLACRPNCRAKDIVKGNCGKKFYQNYELSWLPVEKLQKSDVLVFPKIKIPDVCPKILDLAQFDPSVCTSETKIWYSMGFSGKTGKLVKLNRFINLDATFFRLIGLYLAEGSSSGHQLSFAFNEKETHLIDFVSESIKNIFGLSVKVRSRYPLKTTEIVISSLFLAKLFAMWFNKRASNKEIYPLFFSSNSDNLRNLIRGIWEGDGSTSHPRGFCFSSVSLKLAYQVWEILNVLGILANLRCGTRKNSHHNPKHIIEVFGEFLDKMSNILQTEKHFHSVSRIHIPRRYWEDEEFWYLPILEIKKEFYDGEVVDLWIDGEHSFAVESAIVHNTSLEAMACGVPTITTNYAGSAELVQGAGSVIDVKDFVVSVRYGVPRANIDVQKLVEVMNLYYYSPNLRQLTAQACWQRAQQYDWNRIMPKWLQVLELLEPKPLYLHLDKPIGRDETFVRLAEKDKLEVNLTGAVNENTSWALFNRALARGLKSLGHNVSIKPARWPSNFPLAPDLVQMVQRPLNRDMDIIHHHGAFIDYLKNSKAKIKIVFMPWEVTEFPYKWVEEINRHADGFWTVSEHSAKIAEKNGIDHDMISVVPAGTNFALFNPQIRPKELQTNKKYKFLCVGNLADLRKNIRDLLRAYLHTFT
ncbi:MAG: hypothetical protein FJ044_04585, partial [Candidatus Cloacimonetes bacterium]|nr:hypothetical protein [Candidatus Cloacimonadota bacterium]